MNGDSYSERRRFPRLEWDFPLAYRHVDAGKEATFFTITKTLGLGGLMFESDNPLVIGETYFLTLSLDEDTLRLKGRVLYANKLRQGPYRIGMEYIDITEEEREKLTISYMRRAYNVDEGES